MSSIPPELEATPPDGFRLPQAQAQKVQRQVHLSVDPGTLVRLSLRDVMILVATIVTTTIGVLFWVQGKFETLERRAGGLESLVMRQGDSLLQMQTQMVVAQTKNEKLADAINALSVQIAKMEVKRP